MYSKFMWLLSGNTSVRGEGRKQDVGREENSSAVPVMA